MKKNLPIIIFLLIIVSCQKKETTLEIIKTKSETPDMKISEDIISVDKPLIEITKDIPLQIYVRSDGAPGMYLDEDGAIKGFYVDLEKAIMDKMNQNYELIPYSDVGPVIQNLKVGVAHSALSTPILPDYKAILNLSNKFETLDFVIFISEFNNDIQSGENIQDAINQLFGKKVGVQTRGHIYQLLRDYKEIEIIEYPTTTNALEALNNGQVDAVPDVKRIGNFYKNKNNWKIKDIGVPIFTLPIGTGFSKAINPNIIDRYNLALTDLINTGYVKDLYTSYFEN